MTSRYFGSVRTRPVDVSAIELAVAPFAVIREPEAIVAVEQQVVRPLQRVRSSDRRAVRLSPSGADAGAGSGSAGPGGAAGDREPAAVQAAHLVVRLVQVRVLGR
jgi:hypothetical protein